MSLQTRVQIVPTAQDLRVRLSVINASQRFEMFSRMNCSWYSSWRCDVERIRLKGWECSRNFAEVHFLPPGHAFHEAPAPLYIPGRFFQPGAVIRLRFGLLRTRNKFTSAKIERLYHLPPSSRERERLVEHPDLRFPSNPPFDIFWSEPVSVTLRREWITMETPPPSPERLRQNRQILLRHREQGERERKAREQERARRKEQVERQMREQMQQHRERLRREGEAEREQQRRERKYQEQRMVEEQQNRQWHLLEMQREQQERERRRRQQQPNRKSP